MLNRDKDQENSSQLSRRDMLKKLGKISYLPAAAAITPLPLGFIFNSQTQQWVDTNGNERAITYIPEHCPAISS